MLKRLIKRYFYIFWIKNKFSAAVQLNQLQLFFYYKDKLQTGALPKFNETGFKNFSQFEEDGKLLYIFALLGMENKTFVDIGADDGINSNCANFAFNFGWQGLFVDADAKALEIGKKIYAKYPNFWTYKPKFKTCKVTPENVNNCIKSEGFEGEIDLLSIDIDSNDYWIWKAIDCVSPKVVIIESQLAFGTQNLVVPYQEETAKLPNESLYYGASTLALVLLGKEKNYRLVGSNQYGNNLFFVKNGLAENQLPEIPFETTLTHPYAVEKFALFEKISHLPYLKA